MSPRRILYPAGAALGLWLAFTAGRAAAPLALVPDLRLYCPEDAVAVGFGLFNGQRWERYECVPVDDLARRDSLEVRLVPDDRGDGLMVRAWLWDGDGHVRWTRDLTQEEPLAALWDEGQEGQEALDVSHWQAEQAIP